MYQNKIYSLMVVVLTTIMICSFVQLAAQAEGLNVRQAGLVAPRSVLYAGGSGTQEDPYQIEDESHLFNVRFNLGAHFLQTADIDLDSDPWTPIDDFTGVYNGNYYVIENLLVDEVWSGYPNGLFGWLTGGTLIRISLIYPVVEGEDDVGHLVGEVSSGTILNCSIFGGSIDGGNRVGSLVGKNNGLIIESYTLTETSGISVVGGLVGFNDDDGVIQNCYAMGSISGTDTVAGLIGNNEGSVENCYSIGYVNGTTNLGGLIAANSGTVSYSYWDMDNSGQLNSAAGDGRTEIEMTYPYASNTYQNWDFNFRWVEDAQTGHVGYPFCMRAPANWIPHDLSGFSGGDGSEQYPYHVATPVQLSLISGHANKYFKLTTDIDLSAFLWDNDENDYINNGKGWEPIGWNEMFQGDFDGNNYVINNLYINRSTFYFGRNMGLFGVINNASIKNLGLTNVDITGYDYTGALVGTVVSSTIDSCYSTGCVEGVNNIIGGLIGYSAGNSTITNSFSKTNVIGNNKVGGFIGENYSTSVSCSYAAGSVEGVQYVGGFVGKSDGDYQRESEITNCYNAGSVSGDSFIGGFAGIINYTVITNAYSSGIVEGDSNLFGFGIISGVGNLYNCFYDMEASGLQLPQYQCDGQRMTTTRMMQSSTFNNWDFNNTWSIKEWFTAPYSSYPYLQWQGTDPEAHNIPQNGETKVFSVDNNRWFWVSYPWLSRDGMLVFPPVFTQIAEEALRPLAGTAIDLVHYLNVPGNPQTPALEIMDWYDNQWNPNDIVNFESISGYKVHFKDNLSTGDYYLPLLGALIDPDTDITIYPTPAGIRNWIGYFVQSQYAYDAFGEDIDNFDAIVTQYGGMYWDYTEQEWWFDNLFTPEGPYLVYGSMVEVRLRNNIQTPLVFRWNNPQNRSLSESEKAPRYKEEPEHFTIKYGPDYESVFIADITDDEDVVEIGVFVGNECVGSSVFKGKYPTEVIAYTNDDHLNEVLTIVLYLSDDTYEKHSDVLVKDQQTRQYSPKTVDVCQNQFTIVKIDRNSDDRRVAVEDDDILITDLSLRQNYPNPFSIGSHQLHSGITNISFALPETMPVSLNIYNIRGQLVKSLVSGKVDKGDYVMGWDGTDSRNSKVSTGIYFYRLETVEKVLTRKMLIVR